HPAVLRPRRARMSAISAPVPRHLTPSTSLTRRSEAGAAANTSGVRATVEEVIAELRARGDEALREYSERLDNWSPEQCRLTDEQIAEVMARTPAQVIDDILFVQAQVRRMAKRQLESLGEFELETFPGVILGQKNIPISAAGAYIPGGRFPL